MLTTHSHCNSSGARLSLNFTVVTLLASRLNSKGMTHISAPSSAAASGGGRPHSSNLVTLSLSFVEEQETLRDGEEKKFSFPLLEVSPRAFLRS
jgi:hypothetical protein